MGPRPLHYLAAVLALASVYFATAKLGLSMAGAFEQVTPVWPPTGISLAAILLLGYRVWPGITLGAFFANITANEPLAAASGIAVGNTLEALAAAGLLNRLVQFDPRFGRMTDAIGFVIAVGIGCGVAATIGAMSLCLAGLKPWGWFGSLWWVWWLGDATGALIVAPTILVWFKGPQTRPHQRHLTEAMLLLLVLGVTALTVFAGQFPWVTIDRPLEYAIFPFVVWAALRFGQRGTATVTLLASAIAIWGTFNGNGPFARGSTHENLILLQTFLAAVAVTGLLLGAALAERNLADRRRLIDLRVTHILADSASLAEASPRILREICEGLDWEVGEIWHVDPAANVLRCVQTWHRPNRALPHFLAASQGRKFAHGEGLPGRVWASDRPAWIPDVTMDANFPRAPAAAADGLRGAFAFPIRLGGEVAGVMEFFSPEVRRPDLRLLQVFDGIGSQVGQFINRKKAEEAVSEASRRKDEFLAMLGHELRNPLAPILNAIHILKLPRTTEAQARQVRDMMEDQVKHMIRLVDDLLDVSRIMSGRIDLRAERVDLARVVDRAIQTARPAIDAAGHELTVSLPAEPVHLVGDPIRLAQVFANLLNNAAKYTDRAGRISLTAALGDGQVAVHVRDNGIGIPPDVLPHIFELFVQANRSLDRSQSGLGIGLTLVRRLVALHRGSVQAISGGPGHGSEFVVRLPVARIGEGGALGGDLRPTRTAGPPDRTARRILVVDDNLDAAESLGMLLRLQGHTVRTVHDGKAVLSVVEEFRPQVLMLDLGLPGKSGYEVAKELRAESQFAELVIAAVTGYGQEDDRRKSREAGFDYHLVKPIELAGIDQVLSDARLRGGPARSYKDVPPTGDQGLEAESPSESRRA